MRWDRWIGTFAVAAVIAATGWVHDAAAAGPSSPSTAVAPQVLRGQAQQPADAIDRATDPVRSAPGQGPSQDKERAPKTSGPAPAPDPARAGQGSTQPAAK